MPLNVQPGNIVIADCTIDMADRFLHYNYSGNETWQKNKPLESIEFRNIKSTGISMPITAYGALEVPLRLKLEDIEITMRDGFEDIDLIHACNFDRIELKNISSSNFKGSCLVKKWSSGSIDCDNIKTCGTNNIVDTKEPFFAKPRQCKVKMKE